MSGRSPDDPEALWLSASVNSSTTVGWWLQLFACLSDPSGGVPSLPPTPLRSEHWLPTGGRDRELRVAAGGGEAGSRATTSVGRESAETRSGECRPHSTSAAVPSVSISVIRQQARAAACTTSLFGDAPAAYFLHGGIRDGNCAAIEPGTEPHQAQLQLHSHRCQRFPVRRGCPVRPSEVSQSMVNSSALLCDHMPGHVQMQGPLG